MSNPITSSSKRDEKLSIIDQIEQSDWVFNLAKDYDGGCPCAGFELKDDSGTVYAHSRCWRVSNNAQYLYVWGEHKEIRSIAKALKKALDQTKWYNPYTIIYENFNQ